MRLARALFPCIVIQTESEYFSNSKDYARYLPDNGPVCKTGDENCELLARKELYEIENTTIDSRLGLSGSFATFAFREFESFLLVLSSCVAFRDTMCEAWADRLVDEVRR